MRRGFGWYEWVAIAVAFVVAGAAIAEAIREHSWGPIWQVGWVPAVLVASLARPHKTRDCPPRPRRRIDS